MSYYETRMEAIIKIQSFFRKILMKFLIIQSKNDFMKIFHSVEGTNHQKKNIWLENSKLSAPNFGFSMLQETSIEEKKLLLGKISLLNDKLDKVNQKIIERKMELGFFD